MKTFFLLPLYSNPEELQFFLGYPTKKQEQILKMRKGIIVSLSIQYTVTATDRNNVKRKLIKIG